MEKTRKYILQQLQINNIKSISNGDIYETRS